MPWLESAKRAVEKHATVNKTILHKRVCESRSLSY